MRVVPSRKWLGFVQRLGQNGPDLAEFSFIVKAEKGTGTNSKPISSDLNGPKIFCTLKILLTNASKYEIIQTFS